MLSFKTIYKPSLFFFPNPFAWPRAYERALDAKRSSLGPDHFSVGHTLYNLACLQLDNENPDAAAHFMRETLVIYEVAFGPDHQLTADVEKQLAILEEGLANRAFNAQQQEQKSQQPEEEEEEGLEEEEGVGDEDGGALHGGDGDSVVSEDFEDGLYSEGSQGKASPTKPADETFKSMQTLARGHFASAS